MFDITIENFVIDIAIVSKVFNDFELLVLSCKKCWQKTTKINYYKLFKKHKFAFQPVIFSSTLELNIKENFQKEIQFD